LTIITIVYLVPVGNLNQGMPCQLVYVFMYALYILYDIFNILYTSGIVKNS